MAYFLQISTSPQKSNLPWTAMIRIAPCRKYVSSARVSVIRFLDSIRWSASPNLCSMRYPSLVIRMFVIRKEWSTDPFCFQFSCNDTGTFEIELMSAGLFSLNDLTNLLMKLEQLGIDSGIKIDIVDRCVGREVGEQCFFWQCVRSFSCLLEPLENVNSCFLIELCDLCGRPARGECKPQGNFSRCICYVNTLDPTAQFEGDLCSVPLRSGSKAPRWTPVVVGILSALALLLGIVTCCLLALACWHFFPYEK